LVFFHKNGTVEQCSGFKLGDHVRRKLISAMKKELFDELLESVKQAAAIERGELKPSRLFVAEGSHPASIVLTGRLSRGPAGTRPNRRKPSTKLPVL
jgi:hypothetical protein